MTNSVTFLACCQKAGAQGRFTGQPPCGKLKRFPLLAYRRLAIKRTLLITVLAILGGLLLAVSLVLVIYVLLSFYAAGR